MPYYTVEDVQTHLHAAFGDSPVEVCRVSAKMPLSCWGQYEHVRLFKSGGTLPKGHTLKSLKEGEDYVEYERVSIPYKCSLRSQLGCILRAVEKHNSLSLSHTGS